MGGWRSEQDIFLEEIPRDSTVRDVFYFKTRCPGLAKLGNVSATHFRFLWLQVQFLSSLDK